MQRLQLLSRHVCPLPTAASNSTPSHAGRLQDKVAIVTGAGSGIGRAASIKFAEQGACVYCADYNLEGAQQTAEMITAFGGRVKAAQVDVSSEKANADMIADCVREFGGLDVFFANAGIGSTPSPFWDLDVAEWEQVLRVNTIAVAIGFKHAVLHMKKHNADGGSLIATSSVAGLRSGAGGTAYSASKAAVVNIVQTVANQLAGTQIRSNAICPGLIETGMTQAMFDYARQRGTEKKIGQLNPTRRGGIPSEVANVALFLASDEASYVNGQAIPVCGGLSSSHPVVPGKLA
eukprot:TRINITY_DN4827_c0_g2_i1.p1 TRINITY_DN4827_c0_g2~~TRINITY_DN4827_c0_g2_i1.p1  ORF type:complete len:291 (+),score=37.59 TRINITY_DN4827_c0_g2_i1:77-949(+)